MWTQIHNESHLAMANVSSSSIYAIAFQTAIYWIDDRNITHHSSYQFLAYVDGAHLSQITSQ